MATFLNNDSAIWLKHVKADPNALALLRQIPAGTAIRLEIEGVVGAPSRTESAILFSDHATYMVHLFKLKSISICRHV